jgi:flagellin
MRINNNVMAMNASRNLASTNIMLGKSLEKLSSGFRINRAADDAAGLVVSQGLRAQIGGLKQATRNAQDGISVVQTAEGALNEVHTMLNRMRDLAVQSANSGGNDAASKAAAQAEINALTTEITRVSSTTRFGGVNLLDGTYGIRTSVTGASAGIANTGTVAASGGSFSIAVNGGPAVSVTLSANLNGTQASATTLENNINSALTAAGSVYGGKVHITSTPVIGSLTNETLAIQVDGLRSGQSFTLADGSGTPLNALGITTLSSSQVGTGGTFQIGANANETVSLTIAATDATTLGIGSLDVTNDTGAAAAIKALDTAISTVSSVRGNLGALQNRFESMINNMQVTTENLSASESRIRDTDMAQEMVTFTKNNVLMQAGTAMLAQANQVPQSILSLLK